MSASTEVELPVLAVLTSPGAFAPFQIAEMARDTCVLVFIADEESTERDLRVLRRLGRTVVAAPGHEDEVIEWLRAEKVAGLISYTDERLVEAAVLAEALGLAFHTPDVAVALTDKHLQRDLLRAAGLPGPEFALVQAGAPPPGLGSISLPAVVKPRRGSLARNTVRADTPLELSIALANGRGEDLVIEEYLPDRTARDEQDAADFVSVESVVCDGEHRVLGLTGRFPFSEPFLETGLFMPADLPRGTSEEVVAVARAAACALGVERGFLHTEIKLTPDGPRVVEVNGRIGGSIADLLDRIGIPSVLRWTMRTALGVPWEEVDATPSGVSFLLWIQPPMRARRVEGITGVERLTDLAGVLTAHVNRAPGDPLHWRRGTQEHVVAVGGHVENHEQLRNLRLRILDGVEVHYG